MTDFKHKLILYITIGLLFISLFIQRSCSAQTTVKQKVFVPEKKGEFKNPIAVINTKGKKDSIVWKDKIIKTENPVNKKLAEDFIASQKENDSLKSLKLYLNAIEERDSEYIFDNKDLKLEIKTKTRGEILKITPKYTIKEREEVLQVKSKESVFAVYAGIGLETTTTLERLTPEINLGVQNRKGDLLLLKYGVTDKSIGVSYIHRFINIKK